MPAPNTDNAMKSILPGSDQNYEKNLAISLSDNFFKVPENASGRVFAFPACTAGRQVLLHPRQIRNGRCTLTNCRLKQ